MIEINLVPSHLRKKKKKNLFKSGFKIPLEVLVGSAGGLLMLLVLLHIYLGFTNIRKVAKLKSLEKEWANLAASKGSVDDVVTELRILRNNYKAINDVITEDQIVWSQKMNILSDNLPRGVWLKKVALGDKMFFIEGNAIAKSSNEIINVHSLMGNLKSSKTFLDKFSELDITSIQRGTMSKVEIAEFVISTKVE